MKRIVSLNRGLVPLAVGLWAAALPAAAELVDRVVAVVNEDVITLSEVEQKVVPELARLQVPLSERTKAREQLQKAALDNLIGEKLLTAQVKELQIEVTAQEIDAGIEDVQRQNGMTKEQFEGELLRAGYTLQGYRDFMRDHMARMKLLQMKVRSQLKISDEDLRAEYAAYAKSVAKDVELKARHILVSVGPKASDEEVAQAKAKAEAIATEAQRPGVDFVELAKQRSEGPSAADGGDLGTFGRGVMVPAFEKVAYALEEGQVSDPVRTQFGFHVIKVEKRIPIGVRPFEELKEELRARMYQSQLERYTAQYVQELRQKAIVEVKL